MDEMNYTRTVTPNSMRSKYWRYFGFPADKSGNILTRTKIVCRICGTKIAYNRNTSNLRTHLISRHAEKFLPLQMEIKEIRKQQHYAHTDEMDLVDEDDVDGMTEYQHNDAGTDTESAFEIVHLIDETANTVTTTTAMTPVNSNQEDNKLVEYVYECVNANELTDADAASNCNLSLDTCLKYLIDELLSLSSCGLGFRRLLRHITLNVDVKCLEMKLFNKYNDMYLTISRLLQNKTQQAAYSLSIELYQNIENLHVLNIYLNYCSSNPPYELLSVLYISSICYLSQLQDAAFWSTKFANFNLNNCAAIVVSGSNGMEMESLHIFAMAHQLPVINCLENLICNCLQRIFNTPSIQSAVDRLFQYLEDQPQLAPNLYFNGCCVWSQLNYLQTFFAMEQVLTNNDEADTCLYDLKTLIEYLYPLKILLESTVDEPMPLCSLIRPLFEKVFAEMDNYPLSANEYVKEAQDIFTKLLPKSLIEDDFLIQAMFFDRRFEVGRSKYAQIKSNICRRYMELIMENTQEENILESNHIKSKEPEHKNHSGLKKFFDCMNHMSSTTSGAKEDTCALNSFAQEFDKYTLSAKLNLEQCPYIWWQNHAEEYKILSEIAVFYFSVPCSVNRLFRSEPSARISIRNKRNMLALRTNDRFLWYLHYNKVFYEHLLTNSSTS